MMSTRTQKITPHLWFEKEAKQAAEFYTHAFGGDSAVTSVTPITDTPGGDMEVVTFRLLGYEFMSMSPGSRFRINPSMSFIVKFDPSDHVDAISALNTLWEKLADEGSVFMPLDKYSFSERYGWIQDKYGVSWQLLLANPEWRGRSAITPSLMFTKDVCGKAEDAMKFYTAVFADSKEGMIARYGSESAPDKEGTVMFEDFMLQGQWFAAMDSARMHDISFNEATSLFVSCDSQAEIDYYWDRLSAVPEAEQCGWLKDKYGLSWQIIPKGMGEFLGGSDADGRQRALQAMLTMKKIDLDGLEGAYRGAQG